MTLELRGVQHAFGRVQALRGVSLGIGPGDLFALIGPNGAGKTTAMRVALGLLRPHRGVVAVDGFDARRFARAARARMGGMIDVPGFHGGWSGRRNLLLLARLGGLERRTARRDTDRLLEVVGLSPADRTPVRAYSHGMRQRLGIAQALLGDPAYLVLDEPTDGLDPDGIADVRTVLRRLARDEGRGILISSHQLHELSGICNRVGLMRQGRLLLERETSRLLVDDPGRYDVSTDDDGAAAGVLAALGVEVEARAGRLRCRLGAVGAGDCARALVAAGRQLELLAPVQRTLEEVYLAQPEIPPGGDAGGRAVPARGRPDRRPPPAALRRVVRHELARWLGSPGVPALLVVPSAVAVAAVAQRWFEAGGLLAEIEQHRLASTTEVTAFEASALALRSGLPVLAVAVLALASQSLAGELARGTLRNALLRPLTRRDLVAGKLLAVGLAAIAAYALLAAVSLSASALAFDFGDVVEVLPNGVRYPYLEAAELWPVLVRALASPAVPLLAYAALGLALGALVRRPVVALGAAVAAYLVLDVGRGIARAADRSLVERLSLEACLPSSYLPSPLGDDSYVEYFRRTALGESNVSYHRAGTDVLVPLLWVLAAAVLALLVFGRRNVP